MSPKSLSRLLPALIAASFVGSPVIPRADELARATVVYAARDLLYLDAGREEGLHPGDAFWLERSSEQVARIEVQEVSDHGATATTREVSRPPRIGDQIRYRGSAPGARAGAPSPRPEASDHVDWSGEALASVWTAALEVSPPAMVRYRPDAEPGARAVSFSGRGETDYRLYTYFQRPDYTRNEQRFSFWTRADDLGLEGLGVALSGSVVARYDSSSDRFLPGRRAYPLIRDLAVTYEPPKSPFRGAVGRFAPRAPIVHTIDGAEAGFETEKLSVALYGGLRPSEADLVSTLHHQIFGGAVRFRPLTGPWRYEAGGGVLAEVRDGRFCRAALALDNRLSHGDRLSLSEVATLDFIGADTAGDAKPDFAVTLIGLNGDLRLTDRLRMDLRARYDERALFAEDVETLDQAWIAALRGNRHGQVELGALFPTHKGNQLRPFVFTRGDLDGAGVDKAYSGAGLTFRNPSLLKTRNALSTTLDYGFGTGHMANLDVTLDTPFYRERLRLLSGLYTTWSWADGSNVHTLRHLLYLVLRGHVVAGLDLFSDLQACYDHALVRLTYPFGAWLQLRLGAAYLW